MFVAKNKNVTATYIPHEKTQGVYVSIGFKVDCPLQLLDMLKACVPCTTQYTGMQMASLCFSLFMHIREKLILDIKSQQQSGVVSIDCGSQNGEFYIIVRPAAKVSSIKRLLLSLCKHTVPESLYTLYSKNIKMFNDSPSREEFNQCVNDFYESGANIVIVGKSTLTEEKLGEIISNCKDCACQKLTPAKKCKDGEALPNFPTVIETNHPTLMYDYLTLATNERILVNSDSVAVLSKWTPSASVKDTGRIRQWLETRFGAVKNVNSALVHLGLTKNIVSPQDCLDMFKTKYDIATLTKLLSAELNKV